MIEAVDRTSEVRGPADEVWARITSAEGINHELRPLMRMTMPRSLRGKTIADVDAPARLGRSWILAFGVIPFDYDDLGLVELGPGHRFLERSTMLSMRTWQHERIVEEAGAGRCRVTDRVAFELRRPLAAMRFGAPVAALVRWLFARRHRRLVAYYGG